MDNPINQLITKDDIETILNYFGNIGDNNSKLTVTNLESFRIAFTHESYYQSVQNFLNTKNENNDKNIKLYLDYIPAESSERLEYLGDHILKAIAGRYLYQRFPNEREGFLTKLKIKIEKCSMLHKIGSILGFKKFILLSLQVENQTILDSQRGRNTPSYYEDCFESFVGAILEEFGEMGYIYADRFVRNVIENIIDFSELISKNDNFKDSLQRYYQSLKWKTPTYIELMKEGPLYRIMFTRILLFTEDQMQQMDKLVQEEIIQYNSALLDYYQQNDRQEIYEKLLQFRKDGYYILGMGVGRKVTASEQECAKKCLENLNLSLNF